MTGYRIEVNDLRKSYGGRIVNDIPKLNLAERRIEGLIGPNGAGKTTLMSLITGRIRADSGSVHLFNGDEATDISGMRQNRIARLGLVRTNQKIQDFESLTIEDSMMLSLATDHDEAPWKLFAVRSFAERCSPIIREFVGALKLSDPSGQALSAGEKKLLDIVRCLLLKPKVLLMDEPTVGLPTDQTDEVMSLVSRIAELEDMKVVIIEHDLDLIWKVCEHVHFMADGKILLHGTPEEVRTNQLVRDKYMGESHA